MTTFRCQVLAADGRVDWRAIEARDQQSAVAELLSSGLTPLDVRSGSTTLLERLNQPVALGGALRLGEQSLLLTQLATLLRAGLPVDRSLDLLRDQATRSTQRALLDRALTRVRAGEGLAAALDGLNCFPNYVVGVLRAAERGGGLAQAMTSVAERLAVANATRAQLVSALSYPVAVLAATVAALGLVLTLVVPQFAPIFEGEEARLPTLTRIVLWLSNTLERHGVAFMVVPLLCALSAWLLIRAGAFDRIAPRRRRLIPGLRLRDDYLAAQFTGVFGTLLQNGITAVAAIPLAREASGSRRWQRSFLALENRVREGTKLSTALAGLQLLPPTAVRLIEVGERTGRLAETCLQASDIIQRSAKARIDRAVALANPIAILLLGGLVGSLVAGVMLGIFAIGDFTGS